MDPQRTLRWSMSTSVALTGNAKSKERTQAQARKPLPTAKEIDGRRGLKAFRCDRVVHLYVQCKAMADARIAFDNFYSPEVVSWNALIANCTREGEAKKALQLFARMKAAGVKPSDRTYVSVLKACGILASSEEDTFIHGQALKPETLKLGQMIHAEVAEQDYESDLYVGTTLIDMYAKCGSMIDAQQVFDNLPYRNVVSWNALIAGYAQQGLADEALRLHGLMQQEGVHPNNWTFVSALKACSSLAADDENTDSLHGKSIGLRIGKELHAQAVRQGYESDIFICNTLIRMYSKCGSMSEAVQVFNTTPKRTVVTWSAMIAGYAYHEDYRSVLQLFRDMQELGFLPDRSIFVTVLKACGALTVSDEKTNAGFGPTIHPDSLQKGKAVHAEASMRGYDQDVFVATSLIDMYSKCGSMFDALLVFDILPLQNAVSWNALIGGYAMQRLGEEAMDLYLHMQEETILANTRTFVNVLKACVELAATETQSALGGWAVKARALQMGREIHKTAVLKFCESDVYVGTTLVDMYAKCGSMLDAQLVFERLIRRDVVVWSAMIAGFAEQAQTIKALNLYAEMCDAGVKPDSQTLASLLKACISLAVTEDKILVGEHWVRPYSLQQAKAIHAEILRMGYGSDAFVATSLTHMYAQSGSMQDARAVFESVPKDNVVLWNTIIAGYIEQQELEEALQLYTQMQVKPDEATYFSVLTACSRLGAWIVCRQIHQEMLENGVDITVDLGTTLMYAYGKCGSMVDALSVFDSMPQHDVSSWTALMSGFAHQGDCEKCLRCFEDMQQAGIRPDGVAYVTVLKACSHAGMVEEGLRYFQFLKDDGSITPSIEHYVSLVDIYGRAGLFDEVEALLHNMPVQPDMSFWLSLLSSCRKHSKTALGELAFEQAVKLNSRLSAPYLIMSNIYADAEMWDDVCRINKCITELQDFTGAWKQQGQSWIEHNDQFQQFGASNTITVAALPQPSRPPAIHPG